MPQFFLRHDSSTVPLDDASRRPYNLSEALKITGEDEVRCVAAALPPVEKDTGLLFFLSFVKQ